jgi:hypothetical protein
MEIQRNPLKAGVGVAAVLIAATAIYLWSSETAVKEAPAPQRASVPRVGNSQKKSDAVVPSEAVSSSKGALTLVSNYKKLFAESHDYWDYAHKILPAAKAGNADAQFYLSRAIGRCDEENKMYFQHGGRRLTLDEGLQFAVQRHLPIETAQSVFEKCHSFQDNDSTELGSAADWLAKATAAGQPIAQSTTASQMMAQEIQQDFSKAAGVPNPDTTIPIQNKADPRELLRAAVESKDPEVLFDIGEAQAFLDPANNDNNTVRFAWWLVACQRGLDCSANAEWVKNSCAGDPQCASANSPSDLVRSLAGDRWSDVEQRAQQISAKLDAGQWDDVGLGS